MEAILSSERQEIAVGIEIRSNSLESEDGTLQARLNPLFIWWLEPLLGDRKARKILARLHEY